MLIFTIEVLFLTVFVNCHDINKTELSASNILKLKKSKHTSCSVPHYSHSTNMAKMNETLIKQWKWIHIHRVHQGCVVLWSTYSSTLTLEEKKKLSLQLLLSFTIQRRVLGHLRITSKVVIIHALTQRHKMTLILWRWQDMQKVIRASSIYNHQLNCHSLHKTIIQPWSRGLDWCCVRWFILWVFPQLFFCLGSRGGAIWRD